MRTVRIDERRDGTETTTAMRQGKRRRPASARRGRQWHLIAGACAAGIGGALGARWADAATVTWSGAGADQNWATAGDWTGGTPAGNDVVFTVTGAASTANTVNNIVTTHISINSLTFSERFVT